MQNSQTIQSETKPLYYIVEHFETEVSNWTLSEYVHMIMILNDLYADSERSDSNKLIITNFPFLHRLSDGTLEEDEYSTLKNTKRLVQINQNLQSKCLMSRHSLLQLSSSDKIQEFKNDEKLVKGDDTAEILKILESQMIGVGDQNNICFMDMRGEKQLQPDDSNQFQFVIFGGILGDHPPQDKAKDFRSNFSNVRSLGTTQMTTDTALLVCREILEEGKDMNKDLKFIEEPSIPTDNDVRRYLDLRLPLQSLQSDTYNLKQHTHPFRTFRQELLQSKDIEQFEKVQAALQEDKPGHEDADKEEFTCMEGFIYRVNDSIYPVFKGKQNLGTEFPIIPIGMLDIWRSENEEEFNF